MVDGFQVKKEPQSPRGMNQTRIALCMLTVTCLFFNPTALLRQGGEFRSDSSHIQGSMRHLQGISEIGKFTATLKSILLC